MPTLKDLVHRIQDIELRDQILKQMEREGRIEKPDTFEILAKEVRESLRPYLGTRREVEMALLTIPGVERVEVEVPEPGTVSVSGWLAWGRSRIEVGNKMAEVLSEVLPAGVQTVGEMVTFGRNGAEIRFTLKGLQDV